MRMATNSRQLLSSLPTLLLLWSYFSRLFVGSFIQYSFGSILQQDDWERGREEWSELLDIAIKSKSFHLFSLAAPNCPFVVTFIYSLVYIYLITIWFCIISSLSLFFSSFSLARQSWTGLDWTELAGRNESDWVTHSLTILDISIIAI